MARSKIVVGNWKMYKTIEEGVAFITSLIPLIADAKVEVRLAVPFTLIAKAKEAAKGSKILIGAQNMHDASEGSFTGEIAASMLLDAGAEFVILGHSERRHLFGEDNAFIHKKMVRAVTDDLQPILCIGETEKERQEGRAVEVVKNQLTEALKDIPNKQAKKVIFSYEPVWAIGTGIHATPQEAEEMHHHIRQTLEELYSPALAESAELLYGGSVKPSNARVLLEQTDIDGVLVGGASLSLDSFVEIIHYMK